MVNRRATWKTTNSSTLTHGQIKWDSSNQLYLVSKYAYSPSPTSPIISVYGGDEGLTPFFTVDKGEGLQFTIPYGCNFSNNGDNNFQIYNINNLVTGKIITTDLFQASTEKDLTFVFFSYSQEAQLAALSHKLKAINYGN